MAAASAEHRREDGPRIGHEARQPVRRPVGEADLPRAAAPGPGIGDRVDEHLREERLVQGRDVEAEGGRPLELVRVARHHHDREVRPGRREHGREIDPVHLARHLDVGHDEVDRAVRLRESGGGAVGGGEPADREALGLEQPAHAVTGRLVVVADECVHWGSFASRPRGGAVDIH